MDKASLNKLERAAYVAEKFDVPLHRVYTLGREGKLPVVRIGR
jgi:hypothetical protein